MANGKRSPRSRQQPESPPPDIASCAAQLMKHLLPLFRCSNMPGRRSAHHLRRAGIEVLEAMRALLDETIEWLEREDKKRPDLKRIRVEEE
jgi:predicted Fe-Mo cluster-binding NifX family protein